MAAATGGSDWQTYRRKLVNGEIVELTSQEKNNRANKFYVKHFVRPCWKITVDENTVQFRRDAWDGGNPGDPNDYRFFGDPGTANPHVTEREILDHIVSPGVWIRRNEW